MADPVVYQALSDPAALAATAQQSAAYVDAVKAQTEQVKQNAIASTQQLTRQSAAMERAATANEKLAEALAGGVTASERREELAKIVAALIGKRVTTSTAINGTTTGSAVKMVADAVLIQSEIDKRFP